MSVHLTGHTFIPTNEGEKVKIDKDNLKGIFSDGVPEIAKESKTERKTPVKEVTPGNLRKLESIDIKDRNWESVKPAKKISESSQDLNAIKPSRSGGESNEANVGMVPGLRESVMANMFTTPENSDYTNHAIDAGRQRREKIKTKGQPSQEARDEWEVVSPSKTTANTPVTDRGILPNRSALTPGDIPKVKIDSVEKIKEQNKKSAKSGIEAAKLKKELDAIMADKQKSVSNNWEEEALGKIKDISKIKVENPVEKVKFAKDVVRQNPESRKDLNLEGLFSMPQDPKTAKDDQIKRNSEILKEQRKKREDDRSWEVVVNSSKRK